MPRKPLLYQPGPKRYRRKSKPPAKHPYAMKVIAAFGGMRPLARLLKCDPSTVWLWAHRSGLIPRWHHQSILDLAQQNGIALTEDDLGPQHG